MKKRIKKLRTERDAGASLAWVACISALLIAFALAMTYTAAMMLSTANRRIAEERCYQLARSYAKVLDAELKKDTSEFYKYACNFMSSSYVAYSPDNLANTTYRYQTDQSSEEYGTVEIVLYKVMNDESAGSREPLTYADNGNYTTLIEDLKGAPHWRYVFVVEITAKYEDLEYCYTTEYECEEQLTPRFYHNGTIICWDAVNRKWRKGEDSVHGEVYDGTLITAANPVQYEMRTDDDGVISRKFTNVYREADAAAGAGGGTP